MTTARNIIEDILRKLHVFGSGQQLDNTEANQALGVVNDMLSTWSVKGGLVYDSDRDTFSFPNNSGVYTVGPTGDLVTDRILSIKSAYVTLGSTDYVLREYGVSEYNAIEDKDSSGTPEIYYYDGNYPLANLYIWPLPTGADTITISSTKALTSFSDLDTVYSLPPEYRTAIVYNGAIWLAPEYGKEPSLNITKLAKQSLDAVLGQNTRNNKSVSKLDAPGVTNRGGDNIYSGWS